MQAERLRRARHRGRRSARWMPAFDLRRRDVDRFLEERALERIGLVEDRERPQRAVLEQALERELGAGDVLLDLDDVGFRIAQLAALRPTPAGGGRDRTPSQSSAHRRRESRRGCPTARSASTPPGNVDAIEQDVSGSARHRHRDERRHRQAGGLELLARQALVARRDRGFRRMARAGPSRRATCAAITVGRSPTASTPSTGRCSSAFRTRIDRSPFFVEANRDGAVAPRILELIAAIGRVDELDAETLRRVRKHARLIAGGRREQEYALS